MRIASRSATIVGLALAATGFGAAGAGAATFSNPTPISIPSIGNAAPYPSQVIVSGQTGPVTDVNVNLNGFSHPGSTDVSAVLVAPGSQALLVMHCAGDDNIGTSNANLKLDDAVGVQLPPSGALTSGTYKPASQCAPLPTFPGITFANPGPIPAGTATLASTFNGASANGTWSLFVKDLFVSATGQFAGGWSLELTTEPAPATPKKKCKKGRKLKKGKCVKKKRKKRKK
jgi:hypothetical protein